MPTFKDIGSEKTLAMAVKNTGFLLDRLGEDCHPLQFLRELTTNSIEAILRTSAKTGSIVWDVDWVTHDLQGTFKLCVADNGVGMRGGEMVEYINQLSSSISEQSIVGNYGVGGKIATATRNRAGVLYLSWTDGSGSLIHFWRDPDTGTYGLKQFDVGHGEYPYYIAIEDDVKPDLIIKHGTKIVLHGNSSTQNTMDPPPEAPSPSRWISKYLNTRYFRFPEGITVKAREGWENPRSDRDRNVLRTITGQDEYLGAHCESKGSVELANARAHWWILKEEPALQNNSGFIESSGHVAALYQGELYEMATARSGSARLQNFGVIFGYRQVVIYLEPRTTSDRRVTTNTARTQLLINNEQLPWADWAAEFRHNMPAAIGALIEQKAAGASVADHSKSIRDRLKQILELFKVSRYRAAVDGDLRIDDQNIVRGGHTQRRDLSTANTVSSNAGGEGGGAGGVYAIFQKEGGVPGKKVQSEPFPDVQWIRLKDGTREVGMIEDRAAKFLNDQNKLFINADFRVFTDMIKKFLKDFGGNPAVIDSVEDAVHNWFEQALVETVIGVQALRHAKEWSPENIDNALSEEALTAAVMQRYHVHHSVKRELGSKLGRVEVGAVAS